MSGCSITAISIPTMSMAITTSEVTIVTTTETPVDSIIAALLAPTLQTWNQMRGNEIQHGHQNQQQSNADEDLVHRLLLPKTHQRHHLYGHVALFLREASDNSCTAFLEMLR